jgi:hypothetical protein
VPAAVARRRLLPDSFGCYAPLHLLHVRTVGYQLDDETEAPNWLYRKENVRGASDKERSATAPTVQADEKFAAHAPVLGAQQPSCVTFEKKSML